MIHETPPSDAAGRESEQGDSYCLPGLGPCWCCSGGCHSLKSTAHLCPAVLPARGVRLSGPGRGRTVWYPHPTRVPAAGAALGRRQVGSRQLPKHTASECESIMLQSWWAVSRQGCIQGGLGQLKALPSSALVTPGKCSWCLVVVVVVFQWLL